MQNIGGGGLVLLRMNSRVQCIVIVSDEHVWKDGEGFIAGFLVLRALKVEKLQSKSVNFIFEMLLSTFQNPICHAHKSAKVRALVQLLYTRKLLGLYTVTVKVVL